MEAENVDQMLARQAIEVEARDEAPISLAPQSKQSPSVLPIVEIVGSPANLKKYGSPLDNRATMDLRYVFYPTWRSQLPLLVACIVTCILSIIICNVFPWSVLTSKLIGWGSWNLNLSLPLPILLPGFLLGKMFLRMYDAKYVLDAKGVEAQVGLVSVALRQPRLRYEDIRGVEPYQTITQRLLGIGDLEIGSAMKEDVEIVMEGVVDPRTIQLFISSEMEKRLHAVTEQAGVLGYLAAKND